MVDAAPEPSARRRRRGERPALGALLLVLLLAGLGRAEEPPPPGIDVEEARRRVRQWLEDLRSAEFAVRERAREGLETHGAVARDVLEAARDDDDPEVRRTVRLLLERLGQPAEPPAPEPGDLLAMGAVRLRASGLLPEVLAQLGEPFGARFEVPPESASRFVAVAIEDAPFFAALEKVASAALLQAADGFDSGGRLALGPLPADPAERAPAASAGPFRLRVAEITASRRLGTDQPARYALGLDLDWAPAVQVVSYRGPLDLVARDGAGRLLERGGASRRETTYGVGTTSRRARLTLHLEPSQEDVGERLEALEFALEFRVQHERRAVRIEAGALSTPHRADPEEGDEVTLRSLEQPDGERGPWVADFVARLGSEASVRSLHALLEREDGSLQPALAGSRLRSADGIVEMSARAYGRWDAPPVAVWVAWFREEAEGRVPFTLRGVPLR